MMRKNKGPSLKRNRRGGTLVGVAAIITAALGLGACGTGTDSSGAEGGDVVLELWDTDTRPERTENLKKLISMFEEKNPSIKVNYLGLPTDSYMQKISTAIATKATPDIITPKASDISALVAQKALAPLDEKFDGGWDEKISPAMTKSSKAASPDGKLYLTPATSLADVIYYRSDFFKNAGLSAPASWDDFYAAADKLTDKSTGKFGYTLRGGNGFFSQFVQMVYPQAGVDTFFREDGASTLNDPAVVAAAEDYVDLYGKDTAESDLTADFKTMVAQFGAGGAAMLSHSIGSYPTHVAALGAEKVAAVAPFPSKSGKSVLSGRMTTGFAMFEASKHKEAAWKFLEYTMSVEGNSFWAQKSGYLPGNLEVAKEPWVTENPAMLTSIKAVENKDAVVLEQPFYLPEFNSITTTEMLPEWQRVLQKQLSVKEFLTQSAEKLTKAQQKYMKK
ncbi:multiple sugar transport system substrate-binding protein [Arthrobacter pascens]|uniref:ABC transporter substrate-binding protein n=1 Tax=Arthrobacter pascens TaxID=1677 RepID=UPI0027907332|nr:sugar ABC transporter substrate-binding protein [Arthrobacter pascens]MDQ0676887.1 multiple sugar transport system substrate-binding protein [Arthrobacter pascens]